TGKRCAGRPTPPHHKRHRPYSNGAACGAGGVRRKKWCASGGSVLDVLGDAQGERLEEDVTDLGGILRHVGGTARGGGDLLQRFQVLHLRAERDRDDRDGLGRVGKTVDLLQQLVQLQPAGVVVVPVGEHQDDVAAVGAIVLRHLLVGGQVGLVQSGVPVGQGFQTGQGTVQHVTVFGSVVRGGLQFTDRGEFLVVQITVDVGGELPQPQLGGGGEHLQPLGSGGTGHLHAAHPRAGNLGQHRPGDVDDRQHPRIHLELLPGAGQLVDRILRGHGKFLGYVLSEAGFLGQDGAVQGTVGVTKALGEEVLLAFGVAHRRAELLGGTGDVAFLAAHDVGVVEVVGAVQVTGAGGGVGVLGVVAPHGLLGHHHERGCFFTATAQGEERGLLVGGGALVQGLQGGGHACVEGVGVGAALLQGAVHQIEHAQAGGAARGVDHAHVAALLLARCGGGDHVGPGVFLVVVGELVELGQNQRCAGQGGGGLGDDGVTGLAVDEAGPHRGVRDPHVGVGVSHGGAGSGDAKSHVGGVDLTDVDVYAFVVD